jgi:CRP-like cAMP-binding protein
MTANDIGASNRLLAVLSTDDQAFLAEHTTQMTLKTGTLLHEARTPIEHVYFPHSGMISLLAVMQNGDGIETATVGREGVVGATSGFGTPLSFTRAVVQAPLIAARIPMLRFAEALRSRDRLVTLMAAYNEIYLAQVQQTAACNALHSMEARLARWLLLTRDRTDSDVLPLTQEFLSQMLGVRRTSVNLAVGQLQSAGAILIRRGRIIIVDREALEGSACECYDIVNDQLNAALPELRPCDRLL